jgi:hypothetical protein
MRKLSILFFISSLMIFTFSAQAKRCGRKCKKAKAKKHLAAGKNCTLLKGSAKRKCKRIGRKQAKKLAKDKCAGKGAKCRRMLRRDEKARLGLYGFVGAKKANTQGSENWKLYEQRKAKLDVLLKTGKISQPKYNHMLKMAQAQREKESNKIGKTKAVKTVAAIGVAAATVATGGVAGAAFIGATSGTLVAGMTGAVGFAAASASTAALATGGVAVVGAAATAGSNRRRRRRRVASQNNTYERSLNRAHATSPRRTRYKRATRYTASSRTNTVRRDCKSLREGSCEKAKCLCQFAQANPSRRYNNETSSFCAKYSNQGFEKIWGELIDTDRDLSSCRQAR